MTYILESQPDLVHPDNWCNFDIYDPTMFAEDSAGIPEANISPAVQMFAATRLTQELGQAMQHGYYESQLLGSINAVQFEHGDVVVLQHEQAKRQNVETHSGCTRFLDNPELYAPTSTGIPIASPYIEYWQQSQKCPDNEFFGIERAHFNDGVVYQRFLEWGVYIEANQERHAIISTALRNCSMVGQAVELGHNAQWYGRVLPFEVGKVTIQASRLRHGVASRALRRVSQLGRLHITR